MPEVTLTEPVIQPVFPIIKNERGELIHQTPEPLHPGQVVGEGNAAEIARKAYKAASSELANLNTKWVKGAPDFERSLEAAYRQVISPAIEEARRALKGEAAQLEKSLSEQTGFKVDPSMRPIVVGTLQGLSEGQRAEAIAKLVEEQDGGTLAILSELSTVLTKLPDEVRAGIKSRLFSKADAPTFQRLDNAQKNLAKLEAASIASATAYAKFSAPQNRFGGNAPQPVNKSVAG